MDSTPSILAAIERRTLKRGQKANKLLFRGAVKLIAEQQDKPVFVNVGANDGITSELCSDLIRSNEKWTGVLIEPVPYLFRKLEATFKQRFALENIAIGETAGRLPFFYLSPRALDEYDLPAWVEGLGSFNRQHLVTHLKRFGVRPEFIVETGAKVETLADVVQRYELPHITFLHIDVEGFEYEVWKSLGKMRPDLLLIEHEHVRDKEQMAAELSVDYDLIDCGSDFAGVRRG